MTELTFVYGFLVSDTLNAGRDKYYSAAMMAPLLTPSPAGNSPGRISQLLPTVKCSNCNNSVPLNHLGDHICSKPPPVPTLPIPAVSPTAAASLLPPRLKDRVASPSNDSRVSSPPRAQRPHDSPRSDTSPVDRLRSNVPSSAPYQQRSSPLARSDPSRNVSSSPAPRPLPQIRPPPSSNDSPLRSHLPVTADFRTRAPSNSSSVPSTYSVPPPATARPSFSSTRDTPPPTNVVAPPRQGSSAIYSPEVEIDTKIGGEAGMAGVGRRGFAAAARAAMSVPPQHGDPGLQPQGSRRPNVPGALDITAPPRCKLFLLMLLISRLYSITAMGTPPLSAGSGYSSHSPGVSPFPQSPSPPSVPSRMTPRDKPQMTEPSSSPTSGRMPFFEKFRNQLPGVNVTTSPLPMADTTNNTTPSTALPPRTKPRDSSISASSAYSRDHIVSLQDHEAAKRPKSPSSDSEMGLAYADSTDNEDDRKDGVKSTKTKANPPPPLALTSSILRSGSIATTNHVRFPSTSEYSERSAIRMPTTKAGHNRGASTSSASSVSSARGDDAKNNSVLIAHALGLSRTPPSEYARLGGPGSTMGGRVARTTSGSSSSGRSAYSHGTSSSMLIGEGKSGRMESFSASSPSEPSDELPRGLSKSKSTGRQKTFATDKSNDDGSKSASLKSLISSPPIAHRSNTVQVAYTTEKPKLVARARTSTEKQTEVRETKERIRKLRVCVKCDKRIEDGRWIQVDGGGVLCEHCWKNMYLPKVSFLLSV